MQCQRCKKNTATIHLTEIATGQRIETHLCEACAQEQGLAVKSQIPLNELLSSLLASQAENYDPDTDAKPQTDITCPSCGITISDFQKQGLLGCPHDYEVFGDSMEQLLERIHGSTRHLGKVPPQGGKDSVKARAVYSLRKELERAVKEENYERAAELRDRILELEADGTDRSKG